MKKAPLKIPPQERYTISPEAREREFQLLKEGHLRVPWYRKQAEKFPGGVDAYFRRLHMSMPNAAFLPASAKSSTPVKDITVQPDAKGLHAGHAAAMAKMEASLAALEKQQRRKKG